MMTRLSNCVYTSKLIPYLVLSTVCYGHLRTFLILCGILRPARLALAVSDSVCLSKIRVSTNYSRIPFGIVKLALTLLSGKFGYLDCLLILVHDTMQHIIINPRLA